MARKRMLDPSIWQDEGMAELSPRQQLLYIGLISNADDDGRLKGSPAAIRLFLPVVYAGGALKDIQADLDAVLGTMTQLQRYEVDGKPYLTFRTYRRWQKIERPSPSVLPPPPDPALISSAPAVNVHRSIIESSGNDLSRARAEEKGIEGKGIEDTPNGVATAAPVADASVQAPLAFPAIPKPARVVAEGHAAVRVYRKVTGISPKEAIRPLIEQAVDGGDEDAVRLWGSVITEWMARGYSVKNVAGMLDWLKGGIPPGRGQQSTNGTNGRPSRAADISDAINDFGRTLDDVGYDGRTHGRLPEVRPQLRGLPS